ncbi:hypothetical protein LEMLEM_LOCUS12569, partial [Lemmus lemmus]
GAERWREPPSRFRRGQRAGQCHREARSSLRPRAGGRPCRLRLFPRAHRGGARSLANRRERGGCSALRSEDGPRGRTARSASAGYRVSCVPGSGEQHVPLERLPRGGCSGISLQRLPRFPHSVLLPWNLQVSGAGGEASMCAATLGTWVSAASMQTSWPWWLPVRRNRPSLPWWWSPLWPWLS